MRHSCRTFSPDLPEKDKIEKLLDFSKSIKGPFGGNARFEIVNIKNMENRGINVTGTYGTIRGARLFVAGAIKKSENCMEEFGYIFEKLILKATELDLGTCWIGGVFNRTLFAKHIALAPDEVLPAISPLGYPAQKKSMAETIMRFSIGADRRKPWKEIFFDGNFKTPISFEKAGKYLDSLEMLRLAPSASNRQPWRIIKQSNQNVFHFFLCRSPGYNKIIREVDLQRIDMGIAMCHFELTSSEKGLKGSWKKMNLNWAPLPERTEYFISWSENN